MPFKNPNPNFSKAGLEAEIRSQATIPAQTRMAAAKVQVIDLNNRDETNANARADRSFQKDPLLPTGEEMPLPFVSNKSISQYLICAMRASIFLIRSAGSGA